MNDFIKEVLLHSPEAREEILRGQAYGSEEMVYGRNLTDEETSELTDRGRTIIAHTPMSEFGKPEDLVGTALWLASDASRFVTGTVIPVDGGFSAFSGV